MHGWFCGLDHGLVVDSPGTESRTVLYPVFRHDCVACFVGISYVTTGLKDQVAIA